MGLWRVQEAAEFLGIRPKTLYEWVRKGRVPHRKIGFNVRFDPAELEAWAASQARSPARDESARKAATIPGDKARARRESSGAAAFPAKQARELGRVASEAATALRELEKEIGASLSFPRRQELESLAERLEQAVRSLSDLE